MHDDGQRESRDLRDTQEGASSTSSSSEDTRNRLLAAATRLFAEQGFDGTSVKELADEAGVNVSLISYHFGGKENLYRTCLEQFGHARLAVARRLLQPVQSIDEFRFRLKMFAEEMFVCHLDNMDTIRILNRECEMNTPLAQDIFRDTFMKVFETLTGFFSAAQQGGMLRPEVNAALSAKIFFGSVLHIARNHQMAEKFFGMSIRDPDYRETLVNHIVTSCLFGCARSPL
jgi:AcrR family transcriptional regulator